MDLNVYENGRKGKGTGSDFASTVGTAGLGVGAGALGMSMLAGGKPKSDAAAKINEQKKTEKKDYKGAVGGKPAGAKAQTEYARQKFQAPDDVIDLNLKHHGSDAFLKERYGSGAAEARYHIEKLQRERNNDMAKRNPGAARSAADEAKRIADSKAKLRGEALGEIRVRSGSGLAGKADRVAKFFKGVPKFMATKIASDDISSGEYATKIAAFSVRK